MSAEPAQLVRVGATAPARRLRRDWIVVAVLFALLAAWIAFLGWALISVVARLL
jgi:hypothetical protein